MIYLDLLPNYPNMSLATVYNNLKVLLEEGFVTELKRANDTTTYYDFMGHEHLSMLFVKNGKITDFMDVEIPSLKKEAHEQTGYKITKEVLSIYGICPECQQLKKIVKWPNRTSLIQTSIVMMFVFLFSPIIFAENLRIIGILLFRIIIIKLDNLIITGIIKS